MISIISNDNIEFSKYLAEVLADAKSEFGEIGGFVLTTFNNEGDAFNSYVWNCTTDEVLWASQRLQADAMKRQIIDELMGDDDYEEMVD